MDTVTEQTDYEQERGKPLPSLNHGQSQFLISGAFNPYGKSTPSPVSSRWSWTIAR